MPGVFPLSGSPPRDPRSFPRLHDQTEQSKSGKIQEREIPRLVCEYVHGDHPFLGSMSGAALFFMNSKTYAVM
jgi:hypothetical protein